MPNHSGFNMPILLDEFDLEFSARASKSEWHCILEMRDTPGFVGAVLSYHADLPVRSAGNTILNKVVAESSRYEILAFTLYLYDTRDNSQPRSGLTATNLEKICTAQNSASPGRVRAIISLMWAAGFLKREQSIADSRIVHFEPTAKLMQIVEGWNHEIFRTIDRIFPADNLAQRHLSEPLFGRNMRKSGTEQVLTGWRPFGLFPEVYHFVEHDAGWMLLIHGIGAMMKTGGEKTIAPIAVDLAEFGKKFGVSRSHLRRILETAFDKGLLDAPPRNGSHIMLNRKLVASYFMSMALELQFYRTHALNANPSQP